METNYIPYADVVAYLGVDSFTIHEQMCALNIPVHRFTGDFRTFLAIEHARMLGWTEEIARKYEKNMWQ